MQAIQTKYHGPTNVRGSRISAKCDAKRIVLSWDHSLDADGNHKMAAAELIKRLGWDVKEDGRKRDPWFMGTLTDGTRVTVCCAEWCGVDSCNLR